LGWWPFGGLPDVLPFERCRLRLGQTHLPSPLVDRRPASAGRGFWFGPQPVPEACQGKCPLVCPECSVLTEQQGDLALRASPGVSPFNRRGCGESDDVALRNRARRQHVSKDERVGSQHVGRPHCPSKSHNRKEARDQSSHGDWSRDRRTGSHRTSLHRQPIGHRTIQERSSLTWSTESPRSINRHDPPVSGVSVVAT